MNPGISGDTRPSWTWADQLSTYRFWGLLIFYVLSVFVVNYLLNILQLIVFDRIGASEAQKGLLIGVRAIGSLFGFYLAWAATRWRAVPLLIIFGLLELAGVAMIFLPGTTIAINLVGSAVLGMGVGALTLTVPALIAGGRGGAEMFLVSFGIVSAMSTLGGTALAGALAGMLLPLKSDVHALILVGIPIVIGVLFLLPVKRELFNEPPPPRGYALTPTHRNPVAVGLLCLVPFYWLYWFYRAHGEVASLAPSRGLLSPRGAVLGAIFVPLLYLVTMTTLIEALNKGAAQQGKPPLRSPWVVFLWGFLLLPVGTALIQSAVNQRMASADLGAMAA
jgi:MFS family permease